MTIHRQEFLSNRRRPATPPLSVMSSDSVDDGLTLAMPFHRSPQIEVLLRTEVAVAIEHDLSHQTGADGELPAGSETPTAGMRPVR